MLVTGPFKMTDALRRTFSISFGELRALLPLVLVVLLPEILIQVGWAAWVWERPEAFLEHSWIYSLVATPVSLTLRQLAVATVIPVVFAHLRGERGSPEAAPGAALRRAVARILPLLGLAILVALAVGVGAMLCLVPGIIVATATFVATPALMVEKVGVTDAWRRSFDLTAGYRWEVFGVLFVLWAVGFVIGGIGVAFMPGLLEDPEGFMPRYTAINTLIGTVGGLVNTLLTAVGATVVYHDLRLAKEGLDEDELLEVFA